MESRVGASCYGERPDASTSYSRRRYSLAGSYHYTQVEGSGLVVFVVWVKQAVRVVVIIR